MLWISDNLCKNIQKLGADVRVINNSKMVKINMNCGSTNLEPLKKALKETPADMDLALMGMLIE